ncbi:MAG: hypothetical protein L0H53_15125 [Candidatus Nitrosocosmicus sp.]|nr:hypothetical protein [Candidatus Nitrosocosmicus sp.]MDN5867281.1 hypothetical protein [Candidatus Nitrosocosmicus sp.]
MAKVGYNNMRIPCSNVNKRIIIHQISELGKKGSSKCYDNVLKHVGEDSIIYK